MTRAYCVAGHTFHIDLDRHDPLRDHLGQYAPFTANLSDNPVFTISFVDDLPARKRTALLHGDSDDPGQPRLIIFECDGEYGIEIAPDQKSGTCAVFQMSADYRQGHLELLTSDPALKLFALNTAVMTIYTMATARMNTLLVHASAVLNDGKGYLFLGKSGTGKSTHSRLWTDYVKGSELLNDDTPVLRVDDDGVIRVYGSPWSGKTPCYKDLCAPVGAIVELRQSGWNRMAGLSAAEAFAALCRSCSGLRSDREVSEFQFSSFERIATAIPFFLLRCRPDMEAALICASTVKGADDSGSITVPNRLLLGMARQMLNEGHPVVIGTKGNSMLPFIVGSLDSVRLVKAEGVRVGDIALAEISEGNYVLHRVIEVDGEDVTLMGDGNLSGLEYCLVSDIAGVVTHIMRPDTPDIDCSSRRFVRRSALWRRMRPVRRILLAIIRRVYRKDTIPQE